ncbi:ATP-dependent DNA ligase [Tuber magnatum]|uniref:DNA ligase n=1 Tax=Tuber magnatum TaxID=42249 RepID=A0A317STY0_9PEZI|nr:ATP-dependent DNA ligase [Tuber magnatum]
MSSNKKQTTLGYVNSQTTLGRFFTLPPGTKAAPHTQSKLTTTRKSGKSAASDDTASPKVKKAPAKVAARTKLTVPESDGSGSDEGNIKGGVSSLEMEMSDTPKLAIGSSKQKEGSDRELPTKRTKRAGASKVKRDTESSDNESLSTKRTKKAQTSKSSEKSNDELELSDEGIEPEKYSSPIHPPKTSAKAGKGKAKEITVNRNTPAPPFDFAKEIKSSPMSPWESRGSELSIPETPSSTSKQTKSKYKGKGKATGGSPTRRKSEKRMVASDSLEAADKPESSATANALNSGSETEKPSLAPAAGREVIKKLSESVPPAYLDWVASKPTPYAALVTTFNLLESTTKRLEKISHTSRFLRQVLRLSSNELILVIHLMINKLAADFEGVEMGIGESLLMKAIGESCGRSLEKIREDQRECGDLGLVAMKSRNKQRTLCAPQPLTIAVVHKGLLEIAQTKGEGGQGRKVSAIRKLLASAKGDEAKFLIRGLEGKLRLGLAERTVLVSLSSAMITHEQELSGKIPTTEMLDRAELNLRSVYSELPSYEIIIPAMMEHGVLNIKEHCKLQPGVPVKPMLAKPTKAISEVLNRFENQRFTCEYKYDGERAQIHYVSPKSSIEYPPATLSGRPIKNLAKVFSRNSEDLSGKYPDILAAMTEWVRPEIESFVLDCEAVGWDETNNRLLPFQMLQTRKKKDVALEDVKIRVCVHAFDLLFLNGKPVVRESLDYRRKLMHETFTEVPNQFVFARYMNSSDLEEIRLFLDQSVKDSCEGLMVKMMDGPESFYEPSQRSRNWLKIKKDYIDKLGDSLDLVVIGAYWGRGKRTSVYGSFLLACYNTGTQNYESVCNIGTGFSEAKLEEFHETLHPLEIDRAKPFYDHPSGNAGKPDVWFEPKVLWEVKAADLTLSPRYKAASGLAGHRDKGVSLRFPRFIGPRTDKTGEDATSSNQIAEMYLRQDQVANKTGAKGVDDDFEY